MPLTINVSPAHRRAFERMGLIATGHDRNKEAVAWAVARFLDTAPAVQGIGDALYPDTEGFAGEGAEEPVCGTTSLGIAMEMPGNANGATCGWRRYPDLRILE